jgi:hypothetical protein
MVSAAILLIAGVVLALLSLIVVHLLPTGLNPMRDPVSQYGITRYRGWYWSAAGGAALAGVGGILFFVPTEGVISTVTIVLLVVFAVARAAIGFFPMDAPGVTRTRTGRIHNLLATAAFASVTAAAFTGAGALHDAGFPDASAWSTACGVVMAVGTFGMLITARRERPGLFGLAERIIYLGFLAWFALLGVLALP